MRRPFASDFWQRQVYTFAVQSAGFFLVATMAAMAVYRGGSFIDKTSPGYLFGRNFFSDLGMLTAHNGMDNLPSFALFFTSLTLVGVGLVLFFVAYPRLFADATHVRRWTLAGSAAGIVSGVCFVGVAFTPADAMIEAHIAFVNYAFRAFPIAAFCYAVAIFRTPDYDNRFGWVFVAFGAALVGYVLLLTFGPKITTDAGLAIQVGGQKVIVYGSIVSLLVQAREARRRAATVAPPLGAPAGVAHVPTLSPPASRVAAPTLEPSLDE